MTVETIEKTGLTFETGLAALRAMATVAGSAQHDDLRGVTLRADARGAWLETTNNYLMIRWFIDSMPREKLTAVMPLGEITRIKCSNRLCKIRISDDHTQCVLTWAKTETSFRLANTTWPDTDRVVNRWQDEYHHRHREVKHGYFSSKITTVIEKFAASAKINIDTLCINSPSEKHMASFWFNGDQIWGLMCPRSLVFTDLNFVPQWVKGAQK